MRNATLVPVALSLALHASALLLAARVNLPRSDRTARHELTLGLTMLPTAQPASATPPAEPQPVDASPVAAEEVQPPETHQDAMPLASALAVNPEVIASSSSARLVGQSDPSAAPDGPPPSPPGSADEPALVPPTAPGTAPAAGVPLAAESIAGDVPTSAPLAAEPGPPPRPSGDQQIATPPAAVQSVAPAAIVPLDAEAEDASLSPAPEIRESSAAPAPANGSPPNADAAPALVPPSLAASTMQDARVATETGGAAQIGAQAIPAQATASPEVIASTEAPRLSEVPADGPAPSAVAVEEPPAVAPAAGPSAAVEMPSTGTMGPAALALAGPANLAAVDVAAAEQIEALRRAERFIANFDGGPCVFVAAAHVDPDLADVDAFAAASDPVSQFHQVFAATAGFEPRVTGQIVWKPQCAAIDFLRRLRRAPGEAPSMRIDRVEVRGGASLQGTVVDPAHRPLHLLSITESGLVTDLSAQLTPTETGARFSLRAPAGHAGGPVPQLLVVVAGGPVPSLPPGTHAAEFFAGRPADAGRANVGAAAKLFLLRD